MASTSVRLQRLGEVRMLMSYQRATVAALEPGSFNLENMDCLIVLECLWLKRGEGFEQREGEHSPCSKTKPASPDGSAERCEYHHSPLKCCFLRHLYLNSKEQVSQSSDKQLSC